MQTIQHKIKVLVVDDEMLIRWSLKEKLSEWGYEAVEAENAAQALVLYSESHPAVVLLDINLPDGSGLDLLREIKHRHPKTVVIMITAVVNLSHTLSALRGGADDFIGKPINFDELQYAIEHGLKNKVEQPKSHERPKPRLLVVASSLETANHLAANFLSEDIDITTVVSREDFSAAMEVEHDLAIVDVAAVALPAILATVRANPAHAEIPLLVNISHIYSDPTISGVLSQYRAMPCSQAEVISLARRRLTTIDGRLKSDEAYASVRLL